MRSQTTAAFRELLAGAPGAVQAKAQSAYRLWSENPAHPSLRFKKVHATLPVYSVRIDLDWRAVGVLKGDTVVWFWIGSHSDYERLLAKI
jgi:hypothetical protein